MYLRDTLVLFFNSQSVAVLCSLETFRTVGVLHLSALHLRRNEVMSA